MSSQSFLLINLGVALALAAVFFIGRGRVRAPAKLNLKARWGRSLSKVAAQSNAGNGNSNSNGEKVKNLNVIFMFNGHTWDAYEVLGVPAGSRMEAVQAAYEKAISQMGGQKTEFIEAAFDAIKRA